MCKKGLNDGEMVVGVRKLVNTRELYTFVDAHAACRTENER